MLNAAALFIPFFLLLVLFEWYVSYKKRDNKFSAGNVAMNLTIGAIDQIGSLFYFTLLYLVMQYVYEHYRIVEINNAWYQWVAGYIAVDFLSYWYHRLSHRVNILWAGHVTHHSSEHFNLSNGFRTSVFQGVNRILFWALLPVFGFSPFVLVIILKISGIYDFLLHTEYIPKLGFLEKIFITPSAHRVHHGKNDIYIDKNYGSTFNIWDKLFGTFQEETEKVRYGIKSSYSDTHPLQAIGHHYNYLWRAMKATHRWEDKIRIFFMPPEWQPVHTSAQQNVVQKQNEFFSTRFRNYASFQMICCVAGIILLLIYKDFLSVWEIALCSMIGIIIMTNATGIFNHSITHNFERQEYMRIVCWLSLIIIFTWISPQPYLLFIAFFLLVSISFLAAKNRSLSAGKGIKELSAEQ